MKYEEIKFTSTAMDEITEILDTKIPAVEYKNLTE